MVQENVIGAGTHVRGTVQGSGSLTIRGHVEGDVRLEGDVVVDPGARVGASVEGTNVSVMGDVHGAITALRTISLGPGANVEGDLRAPSIAIHPEARLRGRVSMSVDMPQSVSRTRREPAPAPGRW